MSGSGMRDRKLVLWLLAAAVAVVVLVSAIAPRQEQEDPMPTTYNSTAPGAKAAFLLLGDLGYNVQRSEARATAVLDDADAPHTTYILTGPATSTDELRREDYAAVQRFLQRGGRVLATDFGGAYFLPGGRVGAPTQIFNGLCYTTPEGQSDLAGTGSIQTLASGRWTGTSPAVRIDHFCGNDAVVVHESIGMGEAIWWSSSEPLSNRGIRQNSSLQLLLTSIGPGRRVLFDEYYHDVRSSPGDYLRGLPLGSLSLQAGLFLLLLVLSFSRRSGPVRQPIGVSRNSPIEFAENMGALYERGHAASAATEAARRSLMQYLVESCGLPRDLLQQSPEEIATAVHLRLGVETTKLQKALQMAEDARLQRTRPRDALNIVRALQAEIEELRRINRNHEVLSPR